MEDVLFHTLVTDILDIDDPILSRDPYWIVNGMNSETTFRPLTLHMLALCRSNPYENQAITKPLINQGTHVIPTELHHYYYHWKLDKLGNTACTYCGKGHPRSCGLKSHPDANQNTAILWCESVVGKAITRLKSQMRPWTLKMVTTP